MKLVGNLVGVFFFAAITACIGQINVRKVSEELIFHDPPFAQCHASTIEQVSPTKLMSAVFGGTREGNDDVSIWLSTKEDGEEWSEPVEIANGKINDTLRYPTWNPVLFKTNKGKLFLFYKAGPSPRKWWGMVRTSTNNGKTWSRAERLPDGILGPIKDKPVQLADGTILSPSSTETEESWKVHLEKSTDQGETWAIIPIDPKTEFDVIQPTLLIHPDNKLQILARSKNNAIVEAYSDDHGDSWGKLTKTDLPNPNSGIDAVTLKNGWHLLVYNPTVKGKDDRAKLNVAVSKDGTIWSDALVLENENEGEFSYPAVIQTNDGKVHITYTYNRVNAKHVVLTVEEEVASEDFTLVAYNNPDLKVDLGVGLWAWPLPMDFDEDGDMDLVVSCPDTPFNGLYFFENEGETYEGITSFKPPVKIGPSAKNIQISYVNGEARVMGPGVEFQNFRSAKLNAPASIFDAKILEERHEKIRFSQWKYVDYENDGDLDIIVGMDEWGEYGWDNAFDKKGNWTNGPLHGYVYLLENVDGKYVEKGKLQAAGKPLDVYGAPSPNMYDFDGDGDLDIICGEFLDKLTWFENIGSREQPEYAKGRILKNTEGIIKMDLEMIIPVGVDWDNDGDMDLVIGDEDGRVALAENTGEVQNHMPVFKSPVYFKQQADNVKFGALVTPYSVDWDNDGDEDLICGNSAGYIGFIENLDGGNPPRWDQPKRLKAEGDVIRIMAGDSGSIQGPAESKWGYTTLSVSDWDGDGLRDIIVNSIWGKVEWYKNVGSKNNPQLTKAQPIKVQWEQQPPKPEWNWWNPESDHLATQWRTTPVTVDWNKDGLMDLIMLDHEGYLVFFERFKKGDELMLHPGKRIFYGVNGSGFDGKHGVKDSTAGVLRLNVNPYGGSGRRKLCVTDWDGDGDIDILVNSLNVSWMENLGVEDGRVKFRNRGALTERKLAGHTTSPTTVDWNKDGKPELLVGAEDGHLYYLNNEY